jgi:hypothetical protein
MLSQPGSPKSLGHNSPIPDIYGELWTREPYHKHSIGERVTPMIIYVAHIRSSSEDGKDNISLNNLALADLIFCSAEHYAHMAPWLL